MSVLASLSAFRAFAAVAREGSFIRAATQLNVSASAISHHVRQLEEQLRTPLLTRARNGSGHSSTAPTAAGLELLQAVEETLTRLSDTCETIRSRAARQRSSLVVSANGSFASLWLAPRLASFAAQHPSVSWNMRAVEAEAPDLAAEGIHLAILRARPAEIRPPDRLLFEETVFPVCSPTLGFPGEPDALLRHNLLEEEHREASPEKGWRHWLRLLGQPDAKARIVRFSSYNQVVGAAVAGAGLALARSPLVNSELEAGRLVRLFQPLSSPCSLAFMLRVLPSARRDTHVVALLDFLLAAGQQPGLIRAAQR